MMNITTRTEIKTVEEVMAELDHRNKCVDAWNDAFEWLKETVRDKLNKKATKAILTKWQTEYTSGHRQEKDLGNGMGWEIYMGESPYHTGERNMIWLNACDVDYYSNGVKFLKPVKDFYTGQFEYDKGATWQEVLDAITKYTLPQKVVYDEKLVKEWHDRLQDLVRLMGFTEHLEEECYMNNNWYPTYKFIRER